MLRSGLEDTFYLPDGSRASGNGALIEALAACARRAGREVASPERGRCWGSHLFRIIVLDPDFTRSLFDAGIQRRQYASRFALNMGTKACRNA
jgi:hypothetical protein